MGDHVFLVLSFFTLICCGYGQMIGNPDNTEKIVRPCPTYDLNCIRAFFEKHGDCKKTFGPIPNPLIRPQGNLYIPRVNITVTIPNEPIINLNGRIEEFYINRDTDNLVIAVEFRNMTQTGEVFFKFHRRAKEPVITRFMASVTYGSVVITAIIPKIDHLQLQDAECTTFSNDAVPANLVVSPNAGASSDPQTQVAIAAFLANLSNNIQEVFLTDSAYFIATYIQYNICDLGLFLT